MLFSHATKTVRDPGTGVVTKFGEVLGGYDYAFEVTSEPAKSPGPQDTTLSLRRVRVGDRDELQIAVEITQRYRSGANSRRMSGWITLRGEMLKAFIQRVDGPIAEND